MKYWSLLLVLQDSWCLSLWILRRNWVMRCWDGSVCRRTCEGFCFRVTVVFVRLVERRALSRLRWPRGEMGARCRERDYTSDRHSQFWGDIKLCLCEACWMHLIYIQLGFLARNPWIRWVPSCVHAAAILELQWDVCTGRRCLAKKHRYWRTASATSALVGILLPKRLGLAAYPICWPGMKGLGWIG